MSVSADLAEQVRNRARGRCEYCCMHESLQGATFHVEHVVPTTAGGLSVLDNLAWACPSCNLHKSNRRKLLDEQTGQEVPIFDPRREKWTDHFEFVGLQVIGLTNIGRALVKAFDLNSERRQRIRQAEILFQVFPPT